MASSTTFTLFTLLCSQALAQSAFKPCPLAGAVYPAPTSLSDSETFVKANETFSNELVKAFKSESIYGPLGYSTSFSIEIYSIHQQDALVTHHFSAPKLPSESGVKTVSSDTVYRLGSISKLLTTYIYLLNAGFEGWYDPIVKYIPELEEYASKSKENPIDAVDWSSVTVHSLMSHLAGIARDGSQPPSTDAKAAAGGLPEVPPVPGNYCGDPNVQQFPCEDNDFLTNLLFRHPILPTWAPTPIYSNSAWRLITMALEKISGKPFSELFDSFTETLDLTATYQFSPEDDSKSIVPFNDSKSWYSADLRGYDPAGGYLSTINDLRKVGQAILNSTNLAESDTRRWMKPATFTSDENMAVGAPWEMFRAPINRTSWMMTKSGDLGDYSNNLILLPEYDIGISILTAGQDAGMTSRILSDIVTTSFVPAFEQMAKEDAAPAYAGVYVDEKTNSSMKLDVMEDEPGLTVTEWTFGGIDVFTILPQLMRTTFKVHAHLYPTGLKSTDGKQVSWRAIFESERPKAAGLFTSFCSSWFSAEGLVYGGTSMGEFVFNMGDDGAEGVDFRMLNIGLEKTSGSLLKKGVSN